MKDQLHLVLPAAFGLAFAAMATSAAAQQISEQAVIDAQRVWGEGIVAIAKIHADGGDYTARATEHINDLYAYGETQVMFKPTLAAEDQFRETFDEALSYFIGQDGTEDKGFAISGWTNVSVGEQRHLHQRPVRNGHGQLLLHSPGRKRDKGRVLLWLRPC